MPQKVITHLNDLTSKSAHNFIKLYIDNIEFIDNEEEAKVRRIMEKRKISPTLQGLWAALIRKATSLVPTNSILHQPLENNMKSICDDIIALTPLSYISQGATPLNNDNGDNTLHPVQDEQDENGTDEVTVIGTSGATAPGCSKCGADDNSARVAQLEEEVATQKKILTLVANNPSFGDDCNSRSTVQLEQRFAELEQRFALIEQWTVPCLTDKGLDLRSLHATKK